MMKYKNILIILRTWTTILHAYKLSNFIFKIPCVPRSTFTGYLVWQIMIKEKKLSTFSADKNFVAVCTHSSVYIRIISQGPFIFWLEARPAGKSKFSFQDYYHNVNKFTWNGNKPGNWGYWDKRQRTRNILK